MHENHIQGLHAQQAAKQLSGVAISAPRDKSIMDIAIDDLISQISAAEIIFHDLEVRLNPILSSADTSESGDPIRTGKCELEERILFVAARIANLSSGMNNVRTRVCL